MSKLYSRSWNEGSSDGNSRGFSVSGTAYEAVEEQFQRQIKQIERLERGEMIVSVRDNEFIDGAGI